MSREMFYGNIASDLGLEVNLVVALKPTIVVRNILHQPNLIAVESLSITIVVHGHIAMVSATKKVSGVAAVARDYV